MNGKDLLLSKAFLAHKAVRLGPGRNVVAFRFRSPLRAASFALLGWNALLWIILPFVFLAPLILGRRKQQRPSEGNARKGLD